MLNKLKKIRKPTWTPFERFLRIVEIFCIIVGLATIYYASNQVKIGFQELGYTDQQIKQSNKLTSANMMFRFEDQLATEKNRGISKAISNKKPILIKHGGKYTTQDLDDYLGIFNALNNVYEEKLITITMVYDDFGDYLIKTANNKEVINYIEALRKYDSEYFGGFTVLVEEIKQYQGD